MRPLDIRQYKTELRDLIKDERRNLSAEEKAKLDSGVTRNVSRLYQYRSAKTVLVYVSTAIEVDTFKIIENAWADGKKVAVPRCIPNTRKMEFHYITSFDDLSSGTFGVLEPDENLPMVQDFTGCLMLLPALSLDYLGFRLGYGKGYYDRYLARFNGPCAGICYSSCIRRHMYHGRFDRPVDVIVTEKWIKDVSSRRKDERKRFFNSK
jgi:5-formyltetrahydrofolate cyclo-ligase